MGIFQDIYCGQRITRNGETPPCMLQHCLEPVYLVANKTSSILPVVLRASTFLETKVVTHQIFRDFFIMHTVTGYYTYTIAERNVWWLSVLSSSLNLSFLVIIEKKGTILLICISRDIFRDFKALFFSIITKYDNFNKNNGTLSHQILHSEERHKTAAIL